jgi:hypothetical protein
MQSISKILPTETNIPVVKKRHIKLKVGGREIKFYNKETLFDPPVAEANALKRCALCGNKLIESRDKPFWYCKSKKHSFYFVSKDKIK